MSSELTPVQEFYKGKTIFITGASGFMGKVLLEKLLYSCSELNQVIILMRPKREKTPEKRLEEMFKLPVSFFLCTEKNILTFKLPNSFSKESTPRNPTSSRKWP